MQEYVGPKMHMLIYSSSLIEIEKYNSAVYTSYFTERFMLSLIQGFNSLYIQHRYIYKSISLFFIL